MNKRADFYETNEDQQERINKLRLAFSALYDVIESICKGTNETTLSLQKIEEAQFWAIKGITREGKEK